MHVAVHVRADVAALYNGHIMAQGIASLGFGVRLGFTHVNDNPKIHTNMEGVTPSISIPGCGA